MNTRVDSALRLIQASSGVVFRAFAEPGAMERWIPPDGMTGRMLHFDFCEGGSYRMRLTYTEPWPGGGKSSQDADEFEVRLTKLEVGKRNEQMVTFESDDPAYAGIMRVIWTFQSEGGGTLVTVRAENVPPGIRPEDHAAGLKSSLENLAGFVEAKG
jgi:uncharacterized protein YndB with AHSA1/START domain